VESKIIAVIIGVAGALLGVYLKEYVQSQIQKRRSISILRSNLFLFLEQVQNNEPLNKLLMAGTILDDRYIKSLKSGNDSKYKELLSQIKNIEEHAKTDEILTNDAIDDLCKRIRSFSKKEIEIILEEIDRIREQIEHGTYILGNSDINTLDANMVHRVLQVKRSTNDILMAIKIGLAGIYERDEIDQEYVKLLALGALKESILACRHILPLIKMCNEKV